MKAIIGPCALALTAMACAATDEHSSIHSSRNIPARGTINEFGVVKLQEIKPSGYRVEVIPFERRAVYKIVVVEDSKSTATCKPFDTDSFQVTKIEKTGLKNDFVHFVRVCVYFDEGDSGATSLVLANDSLFLAVSAEQLAQLR